MKNDYRQPWKISIRKQKINKYFGLDGKLSVHDINGQGL